MKQNREIWRDIPDYEGYYEVSNQGNVKSLDRTVIDSMGRKYYFKGKIKECSDNKGYNIVTLSKNGKQRSFNVSALVAMAFLDHEPNGHTLVVDHINGVKTDNRIENLQIVTNRDNTSTCYRNDRDSLSSKFVGVCQVKDKWRSQILLNKKRIYLGQFDNEIDAAKAYQKALAKLENGTFNPEDYKPKFLSKYKGVTFNKNRQKWLANPYNRGNRTFLGYHSSEEEAHQAILLHEAIQPILKL